MPFLLETVLFSQEMHIEKGKTYSRNKRTWETRIENNRNAFTVCGELKTMKITDISRKYTKIPSKKVLSNSHS